VRKSLLEGIGSYQMSLLRLITKPEPITSPGNPDNPDRQLRGKCGSDIPVGYLSPKVRMISRRRRNGPPNCGDDSDGSGLYLQSSSLVAQKVVVRREYFVVAKGQRQVGRIIEGETSRPRNV